MTAPSPEFRSLEQAGQGGLSAPGRGAPHAYDLRVQTKLLRLAAQVANGGLHVVEASGSLSGEPVAGTVMPRVRMQAQSEAPLINAVCFSPSG